MASLSQMIDDYLAGPAALRQAVSGMTRNQVLARPIAGQVEYPGSGLSPRRL